jgi:hypothetical protein
MARKAAGDNTVAIGNVTGISVKVSIQGGDSRRGHTLEHFPLHLINQKTKSIDVNRTTGPDVILIHTHKRCVIDSVRS